MANQSTYDKPVMDTTTQQTDDQSANRFSSYHSTKDDADRYEMELLKS